ncbi:MAG: serine/threonine protein kinase [Myxococcaceae bacterium]|nr:serine/threonine protein kinase [Myxococcaceae bacterium]
MASNRLVLGGRFKLIRHLGGGGMAEVFLAEQVSLGRLVALKVLKRDLSAQPAMADRFQREARLLSTVDHPSVVRVIDFESGRDGTVLVLELADGETLEAALRQGPFEPRRAIRVMLQLAEGLAAIHERGIVHRDIKPQNVVIGPGLRGEQARLLDFGIARLMEIPDEEVKGGPPPLPPPGSNPFVSHPGQAVGTPAYVAPEQATAQPVDSRTDVYSYGVLAYRMLAGRLPFLGPETQDYLEQHVREKPPSLDDVAPQLRSTPGLVKLVMQCLEKKPSSRPKDGAALAEALRGLQPTDTDLGTQTRRALQAVTTQTWANLTLTAGRVQTNVGASARTVARFTKQLDSQWRNSLIATALVVLGIPTAFAFWPPPVTERVAELVRQDKTTEALELIDVTLPTSRGDTPMLLALKAAALHKAGRRDAERGLLSAQPYQVLHAAHPLLLEALAEDFSDAETDAELKELILVVPAKILTPAFNAMAKGPLSARQWGALRWLDAAQTVEGLDLVARYGASLQSKSCRVRQLAAHRLAALGDVDAVGALRDLSELPKDEGPSGPVNCGQDEAADAIRQLKKKK